MMRQSFILFAAPLALRRGMHICNPNAVTKTVDNMMPLLRKKVLRFVSRGCPGGLSRERVEVLVDGGGKLG
jgi:hypothetical protein